jgi:hypothetical protein
LADDPVKAASDAVAARIAAAMGHGKLAACESFRRERQSALAANKPEKAVRHKFGLARQHALIGKCSSGTFMVLKDDCAELHRDQ